MAKIEQEEADRRQELLEPWAVAERASSRDAFIGITAEEAQQLLLTTFPDELAQLNADPARSLDDLKIEKVFGQSVATVSEDGHGFLLEAGVPIRTEDDEGDVRKVDLDLERTPDGFEPENPLTDLSIPAEASEGIEVGQEGLSVTPVGASSEARRFDESDVLYPEAQTDTDLLVAPTAGGVELFDQLRSAESPELLRFQLDLPEDTTLQMNGAGGADLIRDGEAVGLVAPPSAVDAQGTHVPVQMSVEAGTVTISVPHRQQDFAYPILVDPAISEWAQEQWYWGALTQMLTPGIWGYGTNDPTETYILHDYKCLTSALCSPSGKGLFISTLNRNIPANVYGQWYYTAPGTTSFIPALWESGNDYSAYLYPFFRNNEGCTFNQYEAPHDYDGAFDVNGNWVYMENDRAQWYGSATLVTKAKGVAFGMSSWGGVNIPCWRNIMLGGIVIRLDDPEAPTLTTPVSGFPTGWINGSKAFNVTAYISDPGLGVRNVVVYPSGRPKVPYVSEASECAGTRLQPCPASVAATFSLSAALFDEGEKKVQVSGYDPTGETSITYPTVTKVDRTPPVVDFSEEFAEATHETEGDAKDPKKWEQLSLPVYRFTVDAKDGSLAPGPDPDNPGEPKRSGVKSIELQMDGKKLESWTQTCPGSSCSMTRSYDVQINELIPDVHHIVKVIVKDQVDNEYLREVEFEYEPATGLKDDFVLQRFPLPDGQDHSDEEVNHGPEVAVNVMNGNVVYHERDVDLEGPNVDLEVERYYNSQQPAEADGQWGEGWSLAQSPDLGISGSEGAMLAPTGVLEGEVKLPAGVSEGHFDPELQALVTKEPGGGYSVADESGKSDTTMVFDASGKATEMQTAGPATVDYSYEGGDLSELAVEDPNSSSEPPPAPPEVPVAGAAPTYSSVFGSLGSGNGQVTHPADVARDASGNLWVVDQGNNRVEKFNSKGEYVSSFGTAGTGNGQFNRPTAIAISSYGHLLVADAGNSRVQIFSSSGGYLNKIGTAGTGTAQFLSPGPEGIGADAKGGFWVSDTYGGRLEKFSESAAGVPTFVKAVGSKGSGSGQLAEPVGLDVAPDGSAWVADWLNNRVSVFDEAGGFVRQFGSAGSGNGQFKRPGSVTVDGRGVAWVADQENSRVEGFNSKGEYLTQFGAGGSGNGQFGYPSAIVTDADGHLWVVDAARKDMRPSSSGLPLSWPSAAYAFNETSGTNVADSALGHGGTVEYPIWTTGKYANALKLDGEGTCVKVPNGVDLQLSGSFTLEAWVNPDHSQEFAPVFFKDAETFYSYSLYLGAWESGHLEGFLAEKAWEGGSEVESPEAMPAKTWTHVAMTSDGTTLRLYVNGKQVASDNAAKAMESKGPLYIGCGKTTDKSFNLFFEGLIDNVRIYNRALSAAELEADKAAAVSTTPDGNRIQEWTIPNYVPDYTPAASSSFGSLGSGNGQLNAPADIAADPATGTVWVADANNNRIQRFDSSGAYVSKFGSLGTGNGQLNHPSAIARDSEGNIWVADTNNNRIQKFSSSGTYVSKFGSAGAGNGQFSAPEGIAVGPEGNVWVADTKNARLQVFKPNGEFVKAIGVKGSGTGQLLEPTGLAFSPSEQLFVADWANNRISQFTAEGQFLASFGSEGSAAGQLLHPSGVDVDDKGVVWVADAGNGRVELFDEAGGFITQLGSKGSGTGQFSFERAAGIAVLPAGGLTWITDTKNNRVQKWVTPAYQAEEEATQILEEPNDPTAEIDVANGLVTSVDAGPGNENTYSYSGDDLTSHTGPEGQTKFETDAEGNITKITLPNTTTATIKYEPIYHRATSVTVDPAGAPPAKTTKFNYQTKPRRTIVEPDDAPYVSYLFGLDGSVIKSSTVAQPPEIILSGNLWDKKETSEAIKTGLYDLEVLANSDQGIASIQVITGGNVVVMEKTCAQTEAPGIECQHESEEWVVETSQLVPGILQVEALVEDRLHAVSSQRFWVNVPYTPPSPEGAPVKPTFSDVRRFRQEFGLDLDLNPATEQQQINNRIYDLLNAWSNPQTPEGQVARSSTERWGVPLRPVDVTEMEYREWYVEADITVIEAWTEAHRTNTYAGYYVDHRNGGILHIGFTQEQAAALAEMKAQLPLVAQERLAVYPTTPTSSVSSLKSTLSNVEAAWDSDPTLNSTIVSVGVNETTGTVEVAGTDPGLIEAHLKATLGTQAPISYVYEEEGIEFDGRNHTDGRIQAGDRLISDKGNGKYGQCTAGFGAWDTVGEKGNGEPKIAPFVLTAGHCAPLGRQFFRYAKGGAIDPAKLQKLGHAARTGLPLNGQEYETDGSAILLNAGGWMPYYIFMNGKSLKPAGPAGTARHGETLCFSGLQTNKRLCGEMIGVRRRIKNGPTGKRLFIITRFAGLPGDSGAPVWSPRTGLSIGLVSGGPNIPDLYKDWVTPLVVPRGFDSARVPGILNAPGMNSLHLAVPGP